MRESCFTCRCVFCDAAPGKVIPRRGDIARHLCPELIGAGEFLFIAETCVEADLHRPACNLFVESQ